MNTDTANLAEDRGALEDANARLQGAEPEQILHWAWRSFGDKVIATSSFQTQSVALLHMISRWAPQMEVAFLDTGFHFPETLAFRDELAERFGLKLRCVRPAMDHEPFKRSHGELFRTDPDMCCHINKVEPLQMVLAKHRAWVTGIRRDQTAGRAKAQILEVRGDGRIRIGPMLDWTRQDVWDYAGKHDLPRHPLAERGYASIGCAPCTRPVLAHEDERAGRWAGLSKTECGLHLRSKGDK